MNDQEQFALLKNFFSGYFHEDWPCEAESTDAVARLYIASAQSTESLSLATAILKYSDRFETDEALEENLFSELGCYYRPSLEGLSAKAWLERIANLLRGTHV